MNTPLFKAKIKDGRPEFYKGKFQFVNYYKTFEGRDLYFSARPESELRSHNQNAYLWAVVYKEIADHTGESQDSVHEHCRREYGIIEEVKAPGFGDYKEGQLLKRVKSTTAMTTKEFTDYIEKIRAWAAEFLSLSIPDPIEVEF